MNHLDRREATFEQVKVMAPRRGKAAAAKAGACHNFSIEWASMMLKGTPNTPGDRMAQLGKRAGGGGVALQASYKRMFEHLVSEKVGLDERFDQADRLGYHVYGIRGNTVQKLGNFNSARSRQAITEAKPRPGEGGVALVYTFYFRGARPGAEGGAHTIAFYRKRGFHDSANAGFVIAFDPNFGEYVLLPEEFRGWFRSLRGAYGPFRADLIKEARARLVLPPVSTRQVEDHSSATSDAVYSHAAPSSSSRVSARATCQSPSIT